MDDRINRINCNKNGLFPDCKKPLKSDAVPDKNLPKIMLVEESPKDDRKSSVAQRSTEDRFNPPVLVVDDLGKVCRLCLETDEQGTHASLFAKEDIVEFIMQSIGIEVICWRFLAPG